MTEERFYAFAGLEFAVEVSSDDRFFRNEGCLREFRVESVSDPHRFRFRRQRELPPLSGEKVADVPGFLIYQQGNAVLRYGGVSDGNWENACTLEEHRGKDHTVVLKASQYEQGFGVKTVLKSMMVEHLIARNDGFVFHCSYVAHENWAILFTGPSETGKSTQAELWKSYRGVQIINGDRAAVRPGNGILIAEGIPFAGRSAYCKNRSLPIAAIVYLGQAPKTSIRRVSGIEAFLKIWEGISVCTWDREDMELVSRTAQMAAEQLPVYHMPCTPDESAVTALERELKKLVND